jgi:general secretion pathway protein A
VSRDQMKGGRLNGVSKQELIDTLYDFLLSLLPLGSSAVLIIDEAQNLPLKVLEQLRILSNLETDKEKLLQILLVGQLELQALLRTPELRQLDQRISIRYELKPLSRPETGAYIGHRLSVAGASSSITFLPNAIDQIHKYSGGIPRLVNLICDRSLFGAFAAHSGQVNRAMVSKAVETLDLQPSGTSALGWLRRRLTLPRLGG